MFNPPGLLVTQQIFCQLDLLLKSYSYFSKNTSNAKHILPNKLVIVSFRSITNEDSN